MVGARAERDAQTAAEGRGGVGCGGFVHGLVRRAGGVGRAEGEASGLKSVDGGEWEAASSDAVVAGRRAMVVWRGWRRCR